jgi:hypothetical protein
VSALVTQSVPLTTDSGGAASRDVRMGSCQLLAVKVEVGDLSTPDITLTDEPSGNELLAVTGVASDTVYTLAAAVQGSDGDDVSGAYAPPMVLGRIHVAVAGGGNTKTGRLVLVVNR